MMQVPLRGIILYPIWIEISRALGNCILSSGNLHIWMRQAFLSLTYHPGPVLTAKSKNMLHCVSRFLSGSRSTWCSLSASLAALLTTGAFRCGLPAFCWGPHWTWGIGHWTLDDGHGTFGHWTHWTYLAHAITKLGRAQLFDLLTFIGSWHFIVTAFGWPSRGQPNNGGGRWIRIPVAVSSNSFCCCSWPLYFHSIGFYVL